MTENKPKENINEDKVIDVMDMSEEEIIEDVDASSSEEELDDQTKPDDKKEEKKPEEKKEKKEEKKPEEKKEEKKSEGVPKKERKKKPKRPKKDRNVYSLKFKSLADFKKVKNPSSQFDVSVNNYCEIKPFAEQFKDRVFNKHFPRRANEIFDNKERKYNPPKESVQKYPNLVFEPIALKKKPDAHYGYCYMLLKPLMKKVKVMIEKKKECKKQRYTLTEQDFRDAFHDKMAKKTTDYETMYFKRSNCEVAIKLLK